MNFHIGLLIKAEMERQERTPSWLARKIACDRTNIHKIYKKDSIDINLLFNISRALKHNFFKDLSNNYSEAIKRNFTHCAPMVYESEEESLD